MCNNLVLVQKAFADHAVFKENCFGIKSISILIVKFQTSKYCKTLRPMFSIFIFKLNKYVKQPKKVLLISSPSTEPESI